MGTVDHSDGYLDRGIVCIAARRVGRSIVGIESDRLAKVRYGTVVIALDVIGAAAAAVGTDIPRIEPDRLGIVANGAIIVVLGIVGVATADDRRAIVGIDTDPFPQLTYCPA